MAELAGIHLRLKGLACLAILGCMYFLPYCSLPPFLSAPAVAFKAVDGASEQGVSKPFNIYVVSLQNEIGALPQNAGRLDSFVKDWKANCSD